MIPWQSSGACRVLVALLSSSLLACSSTSTVTGPASAAGLQGSETNDGAFRLAGADGSSVYVRPDDTLRVTMFDGQRVEAKGRDLCRSASGLFVREDGQPCSE